MPTNCHVAIEPKGRPLEFGCRSIGCTAAKPILKIKYWVSSSRYGLFNLSVPLRSLWRNPARNAGNPSGAKMFCSNCGKQIELSKLETTGYKDHSIDKPKQLGYTTVVSCECFSHVNLTLVYKS